MNNLEKKDTRVMWGLALEYYLILFMSSATLVNITWVLILGAVRFGRRDMAIYYSFILYLLSVGYIYLYLHYLRNALKSTDTLVRVVQNRFLFLLIFFGLIFSFTSIFLTIWTVFLTVVIMYNLREFIVLLFSVYNKLPGTHHVVEPEYMNVFIFPVNKRTDVGLGRKACYNWYFILVGKHSPDSPRQG